MWERKTENSFHSTTNQICTHRNWQTLSTIKHWNHTENSRYYTAIQSVQLSFRIVRISYSVSSHSNAVHRPVETENYLVDGGTVQVTKMNHEEMEARSISRGKALECRSHCWKAAGTHGNGIPIVKVFTSALRTALQIIFRSKYTRLQQFPYHRTSAEAPQCFDPDNNFGLACQCSHCSCLTKWPLVVSSSSWIQ